MKNLNEVIECYLAAWNETNSECRRDLIARAWAENASYVDAHRSGDGHDGIGAMIQGLQEQLPNYRFRLRNGVESHNGRVRFQWEAGGTPNAPLHFVGTDFGILSADGRLQSITGFLDEAPGLAARE